MEEYIEDCLATGGIRLSASPAGAGVFFVEKKDKTLHPCINYLGFNDITVKKILPATSHLLGFRASPGGGHVLLVGPSERRPSCCAVLN